MKRMTGRTLVLLTLLAAGPVAAAQQVRFSDAETMALRRAVREAAPPADAAAQAEDALVRVAASALGGEVKLTASDGSASDVFGISVSLSGDRALVGAWRDDTEAGSNVGSAYVFVRSGTTWSEEAKLTASDAAPGDGFGATVSLSDDRALIGASGSGPGGAAYVFVREGATWSEEAKLTTPNASTLNAFGSAVSLDGDRALIGDFADANSSGASYVFVRSGSTWVEEAKLTASDAAPGSWFGYKSVSLDGERALIGAWFDDNDAGESVGAAYVFVRSGTEWNEEAKLTASEAAVRTFGVAVSLDGDRALVGASAAGAAYVFARSGSAWSEEQRLSSGGAAAGDGFGYDVSLVDDLALVGAPVDNGAGEGAGAAHVFARSGSTWIEGGKLVASDASVEDHFGWSVSFDGDGMLVGAVGVDDAAGGAYVFALTPVSVEDAPAARGRSLDAFPNPVRGLVTVRYALEVTADTRLVLYDVLGREVALLHEGALGRGRHEIQFDASDLPAGVYVLRLRTAEAAIARLVTVVP